MANVQLKSHVPEMQIAPYLDLGIAHVVDVLYPFIVVTEVVGTLTQS
jgi:hypothetical protein